MLEHRSLATGLLLLAACSAPDPVSLPPESPVPPPPSPREKAWDLLRSLEDRDLLPDYNDGENHLEKPLFELGVAGPDLDPFNRVANGFRGFLRLVTRFPDDGGENRWVLVFLEEARKVPAYSRIRTLVCDGDGRILSDEVFLSGWRHLKFAGVAKEAAPGKDLPLLHVRVEKMWKPWRASQYYALLEDRIRLVRLQSDAGKYLTNSYQSPNHTIGSVIPPRDAKECLAAFREGPWAKTLSVLVWLEGVHWEGDNPNLWTLNVRIGSSIQDAGDIPTVGARPDGRSA